MSDDFIDLVRACTDLEKLEKIQAALDKLLKAASEVTDESRDSKD